MYIYAGQTLARYGFGDQHPFGPDRLDAFWRFFAQSGLLERVQVREPVQGSREDALLFHTPEYVGSVERHSLAGEGMLDPDTPAYAGVYEDALTVVGTVLQAVETIVAGEAGQAFVPIAGLHHAARNHSAGFCVFNDCGIAIEALRRRHGIARVAYVDIDAHHGDGVFYAFESDPDLLFVDFHEDGRFLYPGTGQLEETGRGDAAGTKMNIPLPPGAEDELFLQLWPAAEQFIRDRNPGFIILQCGADSIQGDPITHMAYTPAVHRHVGKRLRLLADECCRGRLLALGGGGYNRENLGRGWTAVIEGMLGE